MVFVPLIQFEDLWAINLTLKAFPIINDFLIVVSRALKFTFLHEVYIINFLALVKEDLISNESSLLEVIAEFNDCVLSQCGEAWEGGHEVRQFHNPLSLNSSQ